MLFTRGKERIIGVQYGRQRNCLPPQGYFRDNTGSEMSRKCLCSRRQFGGASIGGRGKFDGMRAAKGGRNSTYSEVRKVNL